MSATADTARVRPARPAGGRHDPRTRDARMLLVLPPKVQKKRKCPHGLQRSKCAECGGKPQVPRRCAHGLQRSKCGECGGRSQAAAACRHGRQPYVCVDCGGAGICRHGRQRAGCFVCDPCGRVAKALRSAAGRAAP